MSLIVTRHHLFTVPGFSARAGFCRAGARTWFRRHDLDWTDFVRNGISADALIRTGDALALALVDWARQAEDSING
ncbi:hypothetical protein CMZ84_04205 [Lysobacteraceae bacterium NML93-0399]|nr:hypothetical protein CMZ84_04205 [Xanthomonadaceae bacterium NML93-0399]